MSRLNPQLTPDVEVLTLCDDGDFSIGAKRQRLLECSTASWVCAFDDDDLPSSDYVERIEAEMNDEADVIGFRLRHFIDGRQAGVSIHSYLANEIKTPGLPKHWKRHNREPNHLNPVRREFALRAGFKPWNHGEDADYAHRLAALGPREKFIDAELYLYLYRNIRPDDRTNENRWKPRKR